MKHIYYSLISLIVLSFSVSSYAQIIVNGEERYGNEWINYDQDYFKFEVSEDGLYRISKSALENAGFPVATVPMSDMQLFWLGDEVSIYTTTEGLMGENDFVEFYGKKMRTELDQHLFEHKVDDLLNPDLALYSSTSVYFLTASAGEHLRIKNVANDLSGTLPSPINWFWYTAEITEHATSYQKTKLVGSSVKYSDFESGEGLGTKSNTTSHTLRLNIDHIVDNSEQANLQIRMAGTYNRPTHTITTSWNGEVLNTSTSSRNELINLSINIPTDKINGKNTLLAEGLSDNASNKDRFTIGQLRLKYPRTVDLNNVNNLTLELPANTNNTYIEFPDYNTTQSSPILINLSSRERYQGNMSTGTLRYNVPPLSNSTSFYLSAEEKITDLTIASKVKFNSIKKINPDFLIITHSSLMAGNGNAVQEYMDYRSSSQGGNHNVATLDISDLSDQFSYGISQHPYSIKNAINFIKDDWNNLSYILLLGKGLIYDERGVDNETYDRLNLIPTYGSPASDVMLVSNGMDIEPIAPVARISANNQNEILSYLDKLRTYESIHAQNAQTIEDRLWLKRVLHLSAGIGESEINTLRSSADNWKSIIELPMFGANVFTYQKSSTDETIEDTPTDAYAAQLLDNVGVGIKTYYGHGTVQGTQIISLEDVNRINNDGRYPVMNAWGCYTGNAFLIPSNSAGELNVLAQNKGAITYSATAGVGHTSTIPRLGNQWYSLINGDMYGRSVAEVTKRTVGEFGSGSQNIQKLLVQQLILQGDPAVTLFAPETPDYITDYNSLRINPTQITASTTSFDVAFDIFNLGLAVEDSLQIRVQHLLPDGSIGTSQEFKVASPSFGEQVNITLPSLGDQSVGANRLLITLDPNNLIVERPDPAAEDNNMLRGNDGVLGYPFFITSGGIRAIGPEDFAIVNNQTKPILYASTLDALAKSETYVYQLDTTELFNSPLLSEQKITQTGGLLSWDIGSLLSADRTYYWRVSLDSVSPAQGFNWETRSFTYLPDEDNGWNQGHYFQFLKNDLDSVRFNEDRVMEYNAITDRIDFNLSIESANTRFSVLVTDNNFATLNPIPSQGSMLCIYVRDRHRYGLFNSGTDFGSTNVSGDIFTYPMDDMEDRRNIAEFLNGLKDNVQVHIYTILQDASADFLVDEWESDSDILGYNLFDVLESKGATKVRGLKNIGTVPYLFVYNTSSGIILEEIASSIDGEAIGQVTMDNLLKFGSFESTIIGPAQSWNRVEWALGQYDLKNDESVLNTYLIDNQGQKVLYAQLIYPDIALDLSEISATTYPNILLEYRSTDNRDTIRLPGQINHLRVLYDELPEALVNPDRIFQFNSDTLKQGESLSMITGIDNVSSIYMDSLDITYELRNNSGTSIIYKKISPLLPYGLLTDTLNITTENLGGPYSIFMEINVDDSPAERHRFNNFLVNSVYIEEDNVDPLLDVTFDGVHILNGDLVSAEPLITIQLEDENMSLPLTDTSFFQIQLIDPSNNDIPVFFNSDWVNFIPAQSAQNNIAQVEINPILVEDGLYKLLVQAKDASGNLSGDQSYQTTFEIIRQKSISNILNYPNPFSSSTQFVYTLTGSASPDFYKIQIMTAGGKVVREITQDEMGPLKVGRHRTEYKWDGTDEYGDQLANGVYLYRFVVADTSNETYEHLSTSADQYTKNGFGKLVITR